MPLTQYLPYFFSSSSIKLNSMVKKLIHRSNFSFGSNLNGDVRRIRYETSMITHVVDQWIKLVFLEPNFALVNTSMLLLAKKSTTGENIKLIDRQTNSNNKIKPATTSTLVDDKLPVKSVPKHTSSSSSDESDRLLDDIEFEIHNLIPKGQGTMVVDYGDPGEGHSERLAVAYNLIQKPPPSVIRISTNIRMCGACHHWMKGVAKLRQVEIIASDANRIHHFNKNGECSCRDHF